jgi:hypothetical protein
MTESVFAERMPPRNGRSPRRGRVNVAGGTVESVANGGEIWRAMAHETPAALTQDQTKILMLLPKEIKKIADSLVDLDSED